MSRPWDARALVRASGVGLVSAAMGVAGHGIGGGGFSPPESTLLLLFLACAAVGYGAAWLAPRLGPLWLAGVLAAGQAIAHLTLMTGAGHQHLPDRSQGTAMAAAHLAAIGAAALLIRGAETALTMLLTRLTVWVCMIFRPVDTFWPGGLAAELAPGYAPRWLLATGGTGRRGPPLPT